MTNDQAKERPNKSARKRELDALYRLAEQMLGLGDQELIQLGVDASLRDALDQVRPMRASGARNRQLKHCVRFMDADSLQPVITYLADRQSRRLAANQALHEVEAWRDRLIAGGDEALTALFALHPDLDRQHLRRVCRDAVREREQGKPAGAGRKLFRYLRERLHPINTLKN